MPLFRVGDWAVEEVFGIEPALLNSRTYVSGTPRPWPDVEDNDWPSDPAVITTFVLGTADEE